MTEKKPHHTKNHFNREAAVARYTNANHRVMRYVGMFLVLLMFMILCLDAVSLVSAQVSMEFAGVQTIWKLYATDSFIAFQGFITKYLGSVIWNGVVQPFLNIPLSILFGIPGFLLLRQNSPNIALHPPTLLEQEMELYGMKHKKRRR